MEGSVSVRYARDGATHRFHCDARVPRGNSAVSRDQKVDQLVTQDVDKVGLPVVEPTGRKHRLDDLLNVHVRTWLDVILDRGAELAERLEQCFAFGDGAVENRAHPEPRLALGACREARIDNQLVGCTGDELAIEPQDFRSVSQRITQASSKHDWADLVEAELKGGHHAKVAAAAADRPVEIVILF